MKPSSQHTKTTMRIPVSRLVVAVSLAALGLTFSSVGPASASTLSGPFTFTIDSSDPTLNNPDTLDTNNPFIYFTGGDACSSNPTDYLIRYEVWTMTVSELDNYQFTDTSPAGDITLALYPEGGFSPSNPASGCIGGIDGSETFTGLAPGNYTLVVTDYAATSEEISEVGFEVSSSGTGTVTLSAPAPASENGDDADRTPPPITQQVGMPNAGCEAIDDAELNWGGAATGSWTPSWAYWPNGGLGGPVCTRTLRYNSGLGTWTSR